MWAWGVAVHLSTGLKASLGGRLCLSPLAHFLHSENSPYTFVELVSNGTRIELLDLCSPRLYLYTTDLIIFKKMT